MPQRTFALELFRSLALLPLPFWLASATANAQLEDPPTIQSCAPAAGSSGIGAPAPASTGCNGDDLTAPCFSDVDDILAGRRHLLRNDDLILTGLSDGKLESLHLEIEDSSVDSGVKHTLLSSACSLFPTPIASGRFFESDRDAFLAFADAPKPDTTLACEPGQLIVTQGGAPLSTLPTPPISVSDARIAIADFDLDGYDDAFVLNPDRAQVFSAVCTGAPGTTCTPSFDLVGFPHYALSHGQNPGSGRRPATGDLDGDGALEVAWVGGVGGSGTGATHFQIWVVSVCPEAGFEIGAVTCEAAFDIVPAPSSTPTPTAHPMNALAIGGFSGAVHAQTGRPRQGLLLATLTGSGDLGLTSYDYDADRVATERDSMPLATGVVGEVVAANGRFDWSRAETQAAVGWNGADQVQVAIVSFDADLAMSVGTTDVTLPVPVLLRDLVVGRFDPAEGPADLDLDLALFLEDSSGLVLLIADVDPSADFALSERSLQFIGPGFGTRGVTRLVAGDFRGRSLALAAPTKVTIAHTSPDVIVGLPPMHVDFIENPLTGETGILNVSVFPSQYFSKFDQSTTASASGERQLATSYAASLRETVSETETFATPSLEEGMGGIALSESFKESAAATNEGSACQIYDTYESKSFDISAATVFDDSVVFTSSTVNAYIYPVPGQTTCPATDPDCDESERLPLNVVYSGPDNVQRHLPTAGKALEWYQPVTEAGNIFSYPGSRDQLASDLPVDVVTANSRFDPQAEAAFDPLAQGGSASVSWSDGMGETLNAGVKQSFSIDVDESSSQVVDLGFTKESFSESVDYSGSTAFSALFRSATTLSSTTGFAISTGNSGGTATDTTFSYGAEAFVFGLVEPSAAIQTDLEIQDAPIQSGDVIALRFAANPLAHAGSSVGAFWTQAYAALPDVAVNHPERWVQKQPSPPFAQRVAFNCPVGFTSSLSEPECAVDGSSSPTATTYTDSAFYKMRGFFIRPEGNTDGPTLTFAALGDTLELQTRIYNYSLAALPEGTEVAVRFYAAPWDVNTGALDGGSDGETLAASVPIGTAILPPIPAFCGHTGGVVDECADEEPLRNLALADVSWDTSSLDLEGDSYWVFWVVAWARDASTKEMLMELEQHGLTSAPDDDVLSLADVATEPYGNNFGYYPQIFLLRDPTSEDPPAAGGTEASSMDVEGFALPRGDFLRDQQATVRVVHRAEDAPVDTTLTELFLLPGHHPTGAPAELGVLVDIDRLPRIDHSSGYAAPMTFTPRACGAHTLAAAAHSLDGSGLEGMNRTFIDVTVDPAAETQALIDEIERRGLQRGTERRLVTKLASANRAFARRDESKGLRFLEGFEQRVRQLSGRQISRELADDLIGSAAEIERCLRF